MEKITHETMATYNCTVCVERMKGRIAEAGGCYMHILQLFADTIPAIEMDVCPIFELDAKPVFRRLDGVKTTMRRKEITTISFDYGDP